jgi:hypothetical protein
LKENVGGVKMVRGDGIDERIWNDGVKEEDKVGGRVVFRKGIIRS